MELVKQKMRRANRDRNNDNNDEVDFREFRDTLQGRSQLKIGKKLKELRLEAGITLQDLSSSVNIDKEELYLIERGKSTLGRTLAKKLAKTIGVSPEEFYE